MVKILQHSGDGIGMVVTKCSLAGEELKSALGIRAVTVPAGHYFRKLGLVPHKAVIEGGDKDPRTEGTGSPRTHIKQLGRGTSIRSVTQLCQTWKIDGTAAKIAILSRYGQWVPTSV